MTLSATSSHTPVSVNELVYTCNAAAPQRLRSILLSNQKHPWPPRRSKVQIKVCSNEAELRGPKSSRVLLNAIP